MFTGIVEEQGTITHIEPQGSGKRFSISAQEILTDLKIGDSVAIEGCCLTVVAIREKEIDFEAVQQTLELTSLNRLQKNQRVNLERAVRLDQRMGGHLVQGHIDGMSTILEKKSLDDGSFWITFQMLTPLRPFIILKGSITIDGISLTVADLQNTTFSIAVIPHTAQFTTLGEKKVGSYVNIEVDMIAKYIQNFLRPYVN